MNFKKVLNCSPESVRMKFESVKSNDLISSWRMSSCIMQI